MVNNEWRSLSREERFFALSIGPLIPIVVLYAAYLGQLKSAGAITSSDLVTYTILACALLLVVGWAIFEIVSGFKVKQPILFKIRRFLSRSLFSSGFTLIFYVFWAFFSTLLSPFLSIQYNLLLTLTSCSLLIAGLVRNSKSRRIIRKLTMEDYGRV